MLFRWANILINFGRRQYKEHFSYVILNLDLWFERRGHLKILLICSSGDLFVKCFQTICAIMIVNVSVK